MSPPPAGRSRWTARLLAKQVRLSPGCVSDVLRPGRGLKRGGVRTYKVSRDPDFEAKVKDVVGLYLTPPEHAVLLSVDEMTSIQALERTQLPLPLTGATGTGRSYVPLRARPASVRQRLPRPLPARAPAAGGARSAPCAQVHERTASEDLRRLQHGISRRCRPSPGSWVDPPPLLGPARRASPAACILRTRVAKLDVAVRASQVALGRRRRRLLRQAADLDCGAVRRRRASEQSGGRIAARRPSRACRRIRSAAVLVARAQATHLVEQRANTRCRTRSRQPPRPGRRAPCPRQAAKRGAPGFDAGAARVRGRSRLAPDRPRGQRPRPHRAPQRRAVDRDRGRRRTAPESQSLASPRIATIGVACAVPGLRPASRRRPSPRCRARRRRQRRRESPRGRATFAAWSWRTSTAASEDAGALAKDKRPAPVEPVTCDPAKCASADAAQARARPHNLA